MDKYAAEIHDGQKDENFVVTYPAESLDDAKDQAEKWISGTNEKFGEYGANLSLVNVMRTSLP